MNKDKIFYLVAQVTHAHLGHPGHWGPNLEEIKILGMVATVLFPAMGRVKQGNC